jgi:hypothetical protein
MGTGFTLEGFPAMGAWVTYALGSESQNLPAFVVMYDTLGRGLPKGNALNWGAGFLPGIYQGTALNPQGVPIDNLARDKDVSTAGQRRQLDLMRKLNQKHQEKRQGEAELAARIETFELAYRMQMAAPEALDIGRESRKVQDLYGLDDPRCSHFARQCLMARRLVERGVRFVQVFSPTNRISGGAVADVPWDGHNDILTNHRDCGLMTDAPVAGLLSDLKQRGLLDSTLVILGGEFGRTSDAQGSKGRDHNPQAYTTVLAGGGVKGGVHHGATDEFGYKAVQDKVNVHDLQATVLHLMGLDHTKLTYRHNGRDFRLTDVSGNVIKSVVA